ncbi:MAG: hypothetical protein GF364_15120 [Candidatus Lokiarchaeota archaeon]|nr:hypothetical protein [Candidatus Lokiarchaeota archaeon]
MFSDFPKKSKIKVVLPSSILINDNTLLLKTLKMGYIFRILSMFKINEVVFYNDGTLTNDIEFMETLMNYLKIPPYLRKSTQKKENLRYAGVLSPVQTPNHIGVEVENYVYKEGIINKVTQDEKRDNCTLEIDAGQNKPSLITLNNQSDHQYRKDEKIILEISSDSTRPAIDEELEYWNTQFLFLNAPIKDLLTEENSVNQYIIAASRSGENIDLNILNDLRKSLKNVERIYILFGPHKGSFRDYLNNKQIPKDLINIWLNFIPDQGTKSIRTEEALHAALSILNILN